MLQDPSLLAWEAGKVWAIRYTIIETDLNSLVALIESLPGARCWEENQRNRHTPRLQEICPPITLLQDHSARPFVHTTFRILLSTQPTDPKIASVHKSSPSIGKAGKKWTLVTGTKLFFGVRGLGLGVLIWVGKIPWEATGSEQCKAVKSKAKCSSQHKGQMFVLKKGHATLEEAVGRRGKGSWQQDMVTALKGTKHTHCHRWSPRSKMDMAHLPAPSTSLRNTRWGGPRISEEEG